MISENGGGGSKAVWNFSENSSMTRPLLFIIYYITSEKVLIYYIRSKFGKKYCKFAFSERYAQKMTSIGGHPGVQQSPKSGRPKKSPLRSKSIRVGLVGL